MSRKYKSSDVRAVTNLVPVRLSLKEVPTLTLVQETSGLEMYIKLLTAAPSESTGYELLNYGESIAGRTQALGNCSGLMKRCGITVSSIVIATS